MSLGLQFHTELQQRATLAPALRQAIGLLRMSAEELLAYVYEQSLNNPFVELEWPDRPVSSGTNRPGTAAASGSGGPRECRSGEETLEQSLVRQLAWERDEPQIKAAAVYLAGNLNDSGYLAYPLEELAAACGCGMPLLEEGLRLLQRLEPAGIGARDARECLLLQAARDSEAPRFAVELIAGHLPELARGRLDRIRKETGLAPEELDRAVAYILGLHPRPYVARGRMPGAAVIPEARIELRGSRRHAVWNAAARPGLTVRDDYADWLKDKEGADLRAYVDSRLASAHWLVKGVAYRSKSIRNVIGAIAEAQTDFLAAGPERLKPLRMEAIAGRLGVHLSTVSRTVRDKYIDTPYGVLPLAYFFSGGIPSERGAPVAVRTIRQRIRDLIARERRDRPLSDRQIADLLGREGIELSRRTVAKYREEEHIGNAAARRSLGATLAAGRGEQR